MGAALDHHVPAVGKPRENLSGVGRRRVRIESAADEEHRHRRRDRRAEIGTKVGNSPGVADVGHREVCGDPEEGLGRLGPDFLATSG